MSGVTMAADSAAADTVTQRMTCYTGGRISTQQSISTWHVTVTAPATATRGQPTPVYIKIEATWPWSNKTEPAGKAYALATVRLGGDGSGDIRIEPYLTNPTPVPAGAPWRVEGTRQITFPTAGTVTLAVRAWGVPLWYGCGTPAGETTPVADTVTVQP